MDNSSEWVDFKAVKRAVTMEQLLDHYAITGLKKTKNELRGKCPVHLGADNKHFTVNLSKSVFKCFFRNCGAHGNVLDFVATMEGCTVREAALKMRDWFKVGQTPGPSESAESVTKSEIKRGMYRDNSDKEDGMYEVIIPLALSDDLEPVLVYRELFGEYRYFVAAPENFDQTGTPMFVLVREV